MMTIFIIILITNSLTIIQTVRNYNDMKIKCIHVNNYKNVILSIELH